jgi:hypothetical protein
MSNHPVRDFLDGGRRHKALKFPTVGTEYSGRITAAPELRQQRDYLSKQPMVWPDGEPKMQLVVTLTLDAGCRDGDDDDGKRALFVQGQMRAALSDALAEAGAGVPEVGGHLRVIYVGDEPIAGLSPAKLYQIDYKPPATAAWGAPRLDDDEPNF